MFGYYTFPFSVEKIETLVPFGSTEHCDSASEVFTLVQQDVEMEYSGIVKFIDYHSGLETPFDYIVNMSGSWKSCGANGLDRSDFGLQTGRNTSFVPIMVNLTSASPAETVSTILRGDYNVTVTSTNNCFSLTCGYSFEVMNRPPNIEYYLDNTLIFIIPTTLREATDGEVSVLGNCQLMASIVTTPTSVSASCASSIVGTVYFVLSESNSISSSGTYLCTKYLSVAQTLSSTLSLLLTGIGACRIYFAMKAFYQRA
jgi:hypothetical protein